MTRLLLAIAFLAWLFAGAALWAQSLPGGGERLGLGAWEQGPVALVRSRPGALAELMVLAGQEWKRAELPGGAAGERLELVPGLEGFVLVAPAIGQAWSGRVSADDKGVSVGWGGRAVAVAGGGGEEREFRGDFGCRVG